MNNIDNIILTIKHCWYCYAPATSSNELKNSFLYEFPLDYLRFIEGLGEGSIEFEEFMFSTWNFDYLLEMNRSYEIEKYLNGLVAIGTDGGSICFLLDFRMKGETRFCSVSLGDLEVDEVKILASSFTEGLERMLQGKIKLEDII